MPSEVVEFLQKQDFMIVSTVDENGFPHTACKGIVKIFSEGKVYLLDVYLKNTYANLKRNPNVGITAVDEHHFKGYCLQGKAKIHQAEKISAELLRDWEAKVASRITQRLLKNIRDQKGHPAHPEAKLPKPEYMIEVDVDNIIDLTPQHLK